MSEDRYAGWLGDYVDGTLNEPNRRLLEAHFGNCESCRQASEDLRRIKEAAGTLPKLVPPEEIWNRIAVSLRAQMPGSKTPLVQSWLRSNWWALAASILVVISSFLAGVWWSSSKSKPATEDTTQLAHWVASELAQAERHYMNAIAGLEDIIEKEKQAETLDPEVMAVLNANLDLIEKAIGESRAAARAQPDSRVARDSLLQALRNKLGLLQNTIMLINEVRKGRGQSAYDLINKIEDSQPPSNPIGS